MTTNTEKRLEEWEKRFDEEFTKPENEETYQHWRTEFNFMLEKQHILQVKSFIASELQKQKEELVEMVKGMKLGNPLNSNAVAYNQALDDIIKKIEEVDN